MNVESNLKQLSSQQYASIHCDIHYKYVVRVRTGCQNMLRHRCVRTCTTIQTDDERNRAVCSSDVNTCKTVGEHLSMKTVFISSFA